MCILPSAAPAVAPIPAASTCPAKLLEPEQRQHLAVQALGGSFTITEVDVNGEYTTGPAASFHVFFYSDSATLPGALVATRLANTYTNPCAPPCANASQ